MIGTVEEGRWGEEEEIDVVRVHSSANPLAFPLPSSTHQAIIEPVQVSQMFRYFVKCGTH